MSNIGFEDNFHVQSGQQNAPHMPQPPQYAGAPPPYAAVAQNYPPNMPQHSNSAPVLQLPKPEYAQMPYPGPQQGQGQLPVSHSQPAMYNLQQSTNVIITSQPQPGGVVYTQPVDVGNWMGPAILACMFCFWPTGLAAIFAASAANEAAARGDAVSAIYHTNRARTLTIVSVIFGISWIIVVIAVNT